VLEQPLASDDVCTRWSRHKAPSTIVNQRLVLFRHCSAPIGIGKHIVVVRWKGRSGGCREAVAVDGAKCDGLGSGHRRDAGRGAGAAAPGAAFGAADCTAGVASAATAAQQVALLLVLEAPGVPVAQQEALQVPLRSQPALQEAGHVGCRLRRSADRRAKTHPQGERREGARP
jgi:hypothetical protein